MPGIFGVVGNELEKFDALKEWFDRIQGPTSTIRRQGVRLGMHTHGRHFPVKEPVVDEQERLVSVIDGYLCDDESPAVDESSANALVRAASRRLISRDSWTAESRPEGVFNLVVFDEQAQKLFIACGEGGLFPLYYVRLPAGFLFCSFIKPLARAIGASVDPVGVAERFTLGWTIGSRTCYQFVSRLLPRESLVYDIKDQHLTSRCFVSSLIPAKLDQKPQDVLDNLWVGWLKACEQSTARPGTYGLMMSSGLDSRIVLAALRKLHRPVLTCTHGQRHNFELLVARAVSRMGAGKARHTEIELDRNLLGTIEELGQLYEACEHGVFPHWRLASSHFQEADVVAVATGFAGDWIIGGGTMKADTKRERFKRALASALSYPPDIGQAVSDSELENCVTEWYRRARRRFSSNKHFLQVTWQSAIEDSMPALRNDVEAEVNRMAQNGLAFIQQVEERFALEHRARKNVFGQELTLRIHNDVVVPTMHSSFLQLCTNLSPRIKAEHGLYYKLLRRHCPALSLLPTANIPIPIILPQVALELARVGRHLLGSVTRRLYIKSKGRFRHPTPFGWLNFEVWVRDGNALEVLSEAFRGNIFDDNAVATHFEDIRQFRRRFLDGQHLLSWLTLKFLIEGL